MNVEVKKRATINPVRIVNLMRKEKGLPPVRTFGGREITREVVRQITIEAWKKYPQVFTDPYYQLGEMTLYLVEQEIKQRLDDLRRGVVVKQAALKDYFN